MKNVKKLKKGRVIASTLILVLVALIVGIVKIASIDKYAGLVKVQNATLASMSTKLSANISDLSEDNNIEVKGYDEIDYNISYKLSEVVGDRDVIINAKIDDGDIYSSFKEVTGENISSVLSSNRKEITITISNQPSNVTINSKITMVIENAPKGYSINPVVRIKESTSDDYTNITVKPVTVNTNSLQGKVIDEEGNTVSNILVSLKKNNEIIKETYVNSNGYYTFSDITPDTYSVVVNEENYEDVELNNLYINEGNILNLIVKRVYPYKIETNKYITKVELNNLGSSKDYLYNDTTLVQIPVKKVDNLHGKIYYKITVQNTGSKAGIIAAVKDELPEGLSFDEKLNSGYELKNGIIYNRNLEGIELAAGEMIADTLVLTIENTDVAKTYINKVNAKGELYEHVVYLMNGRQFKTLDVLEGEVLEEAHVNNPDFSGWYTDEKLTNKYNFDLPVEKDLILYGVTARKHTVIFNDKHPETLEVTKYDEQKVNNGEPVVKPTPDPSKTGYDFCGWEKDDVEWDFNNVVTEDITLTSKYCIKSYNVEFYDKSASNGTEYSKILTLTKVYKSTLSNSEAPDLSNVWEGHNFLQWTTDQGGNNPYDFNALITGPVKLYAQYTLQDRLFIFNDENDITQKTVDYGSTVTEIAPNGKEGHDFLFWSLTPPSSTETKTAFDFNTPIYQTTTVYAIYQIKNYPVVFNDVDPWTGITTPHDTQNIDHGEKATRPVDPDEKEGHTFCGWLDGTTAYDFDTIITGPKTLTACYEKNKVDVYFMNGTDLWQKKTIDYGDLVTTADTTPTDEHSIFAFWSEDNQNPFDFANTQIKRDTYLYSVFENITPPTITHTPLYWTNDKVLVTISHTNTSLSFKYKVDDGTYQDYTEPFELETNSTIVAKSVYGDSESEIVNHEVTNIDKLNPIIGTITPTSTKSTILLNGVMDDNESGIAQIKVYKGNDLAGTVNGTAINADLRDYAKSKEMNLVVSDLETNTEYTFTIEVTDGAGNISTETVTVSTSPEEPICQIISVDGVDLNPEDYMPFTLLELAIKDSHCDSKCTIQMLKGTTESVDILNTQDITLDLNGQTVAGILPGYTINNQGEFTIVDDAPTAGGLINGNGIAIFNNTGSKFTMGRGSSEPPVGSETRTVSITVPYIFGETYGVYSEHESEYSFFDGKVRGTNAIQGEVTETEYLYNATSANSAGYEQVTLAIQVEPEARINKSKYYANVANAMTDTRGGTVSMDDTPATLLSGFSHVDSYDSISDYSDVTSGYPFVYDSENDTLTSGNSHYNSYGSMAFTQTIIDLTDYTENQLLEVEYHVDPNVNGSYGTATLNIYRLNDNNSQNSASSDLYPVYTVGDKRGYSLYKGNKYLVKMSFKQPLSIEQVDFVPRASGGYNMPDFDKTPQSKVVITNAFLYNDYEREQANTENIEGNAYGYGFYYDDATATIRSNSQYTGAQQAYGYIELDLTNKPGNYTIAVSASLETFGSTNAAVYLTENDPKLQTYAYSNSDSVLYYSTYNSSSYEKYAEYNGYPTPFVKVGPLTGSKIIQGGKKYYINLQFYRYTTSTPSQEAFEYYNNKDQFIINSINVYRTGEVQELDMIGEMKGNAFDFENPFEYSSSYGGGTYYGQHHMNPGEYHDSYIKIDLTDSEVDKILQVDDRWYAYNYLDMYITSNNRGLAQSELSDRTKMIMYKDDTYGTGNLYTSSSLGPSSYANDFNNAKSEEFILEKGNVYYVHFNVRRGFSNYRSTYPDDLYECNDNNNYGYCSGWIKGLKLRDIDTRIYSVGKIPINVGTVDYDSLDEDVNTITTSTGSVPIIKSTLETGYVWNEERNMYVLENKIPYFHAAAWTGMIDLTNETEPKTYQFVWDWDTTGNLSWADWYTVDELYPIVYPNNASSNPPRNYDYVSISTNGYIILQPGHKYYLYHFVYRNSSSNITTDGFRYEEVKGESTKEYVAGEKHILFNEDVDEVQILKDIQLKNSIVVESNKEVVFDLNGHTVTSSLGVPLIDNSGKLTIIDSDYQNQTSENKKHNGVLQSSSGNVITNNIDGELIIKNAEIRNKRSGQYNAAIYNYGDLRFVEDYDSKIYVDALNAIGIRNTPTGIVEDTGNSVEIILNYKEQNNVSGTAYVINSSSYNSLGTGVYNEGFFNAYGLKISGKHGTGFYNTTSGVAVIKESNINVDINTYDKNNNYDSDSRYHYRYKKSSSYYDIMDFSIKNYGLMTVTQMSQIGTRTYNHTNSELIFTNGSSASDFVWSKGKFYGTNAFRVNNALLRGDTIMDNCNGVNDILDNYGNLEVRNYSATSSTINNRENGVIKGTASSFHIINNYNNGQMQYDSGSASYILNNGHTKLSNFTVLPNPSTHTEAIKNTGILDLEYKVNVGRSGNLAKYGIYMDTIGYKQTKLNIGTPDIPDSEVKILASENGVTGNCYYYPRRNQYYYSGSGTNRGIYSYTNQKITYLDGTSEYFEQSKYDQDLCIVNMYTGYISSDQYPGTYSRTMAIPISNTIDDAYSYWASDSGTSGLKVVSRNSITSTAGYAKEVKIGDQEYLTIQDAIDSVPDGGTATIDAINNIISAKSIVIPEGKNITLKLNGNNSANFAYYSYVNNGDLTINGSGYYAEMGKYLFNNYGNLTINDGTFTNNYSYNKMERSAVKNNGTAVINNGTFNQSDINNNANLTINNGVYDGTMVYGDQSTSLTTVKGGYFPTSSDAIDTYYSFITGLNASNQREFKTNNNWRHIFEVSNGAKVVVDGLNTTTDTRYTYFRPLGHVDNATIEFKNSTIDELSSESNPIRYISATNGGEIIFNGGRYDNIYIDDCGGKVTVKDGDLTAYKNGTEYMNLLFMRGTYPTAEIIGGNLSSNKRAIGVSEFSDGYNLVIGTKGDKDENNDAIVSKTSPRITGETWSIAKYGTGSGQGFTGFYDGILRGKSAASDINFDEIEDDYEIIDDTEDSYNTKYLDQRNLVYNTTRDKVYKTFQKAFNEAEENDILITLRNYTNTRTTAPIVVPETAKFTLVVFHTLTINNPEFIINNGDFELLIANTELQGQLIPAFSAYLGYPNSDGSISVNVASNVIVNNGKLSLDAHIHDLKSDGSRREVILNNPTGELTINRAIIDSVQRVLINNKGTLYMNNADLDLIYVAGGNVDYALVNTGTAYIDNMNLDSPYIDPIISNEGSMTIDNSSIKQIGSQITFSYGWYYYSHPYYDHMLIQNHNYMEIKNSTLRYVPSKITNDRNINEAVYDDSAYIANIPNKDVGPGDSVKLVLDNDNIDISVLGLVLSGDRHVDNLDNSLHNYVEIKNTTLRTLSYAVEGTGIVDIKLKDNNFNVRGSIVQSPRYPNSNRISFYDPTYGKTMASWLTKDSNDNGIDPRSTITVDGGTYNSEAQYYLGGNYVVDGISGTKSYNMHSGAFKVSVFENNATMTMKDATVNVTHNSYSGYASVSTDIYYDFVKHYDGTTGGYNYVTANEWFGLITTFGSLTITNSEFNQSGSVTNKDMAVIRGYGNNAIITLGEKDGVYDDQKPAITARYWATPISLYKDMGGIRFYDGIISTQNASGIAVNNNSEDMDRHFIDKEEGYVISGTNKERYLTKEKVIKNVTQDISYSNIQEAITAANNNDELQMLKPTVRMGVGDDAVIDGKTLVLDANCVSVSNHIGLINNAKLTVNSSACDANSGATNSNIDEITVNDTSSLVINEGLGTAVANDSASVTITSSSRYRITANDAATVNVQNGSGSGNSVMVTLNDQSTININDGKASKVELYDNSTINNICSDDSSLTITDLYNYSNGNVQLSCGTIRFYNYGSMSISGGTYSYGENRGTLNVSGGRLSMHKNYADINITDGTFETLFAFAAAKSDVTNVNITGGTFVNTTGNWPSLNLGDNQTTTDSIGTINATISGGTFDTLSTSTENSGTINLTITDATINTLRTNKYSYTYVKGGTITYLDANSGTVYIGTQDGVVDSTKPIISRTDGSGLNVNGAAVRFFDGKITGKNPPGAIFGKITAVEDDYKIAVTDNGDGTETAYLTPVTIDDSLVAMVNGINYNSLQQAINKSVMNCTSGSVCPKVTIFINIELDAPLTIESGYSVDIKSNGYTISTNGFAVPSSITLDGAPIVDETVGGNIVNSLRGALGLDTNTKDVLIYEMSNGAALSTENHYKLYSYTGSDYELVTMEKGDSVARYTPGKGLTNMKPIKGRLYLIGLEPGDYKVTDDNGSEVTFTISDEGALSGHVKEYVPVSEKIESTGEAKLLISIQTGIRRVNYMLIAISIIAVLSVMFVLQRRKQNKKNLV